MADTGMKWYVMRAISGKEGKVKEYVGMGVLSIITIGMMLFNRSRIVKEGKNNK